MVFTHVKDDKSFLSHSLHGFGEQRSAFVIFQNADLHKNKLHVRHHLRGAIQNVQFRPLNI